MCAAWGCIKPEYSTLCMLRGWTLCHAQVVGSPGYCWRYCQARDSARDSYSSIKRDDSDILSYETILQMAHYVLDLDS